MIALESVCQQIESRKLDPREELAFNAVNYFGMTAEPKGLRLGSYNLRIKPIPKPQEAEDAA